MAIAVSRPLASRPTARASSPACKSTPGDEVRYGSWAERLDVSIILPLYPRDSVRDLKHLDRKVRANSDIALFDDLVRTGQHSRRYDDPGAFAVFRLANSSSVVPNSASQRSHAVDLDVERAGPGRHVHKDA